MNEIITIVDYGMGNIGSIANMIKKVGGEAQISSDKLLIENAKKIIIPGVGAFDSGLIEVLNKKALIDKVPILGICLGMQLMTKRSDEGELSGLSWIDAETFKFKTNDNHYRIPHMGWNNLEKSKDHEIISDIDFDESRYYFVHSYFVKCNDESDVLLKCNYINSYCAAFQRENIIGVQFHPEKSHRFGMQMFKNFISL